MRAKQIRKYLALLFLAANIIALSGYHLLFNVRTTADALMLYIAIFFGLYFLVSFVGGFALYSELQYRNTPENFWLRLAYFALGLAIYGFGIEQLFDK